MKKITIILIALIALTTGCTSKTNSGAASDKETINNKEKKGKIMELNVQEFKKKVFDYEKKPQSWEFEGDKPAVVDFYATWCGPCKMLSPIIDEMSEKYDGKVDFYKIDVDKQQELAAVFGIRSIPTLLFIPKEGQPTIMQGAMSKGDMDSTIQKVLLSQGK
ncbi:thioredoxin [Prevotella sp. OH937_COT-195]|uniref:thioredoxin n=1 Tax=Prevotella sp. OH937_COT-195 TaxID=2491051 RepID=UPI000F64BCBF|nr:thioredoxin [Prevotella sp. OH937_COT-195]RRD02897.1 thioredoxin [Prevotella sp. OH937_COT-195]